MLSWLSGVLIAWSTSEAFFLRVLGDPWQPGSAPWPAVSEMKPKQELKYLAREFTFSKFTFGLSSSPGFDGVV
jgi:hypothetical protein